MDIQTSTINKITKILNKNGYSVVNEHYTTTSGILTVGNNITIKYSFLDIDRSMTFIISIDGRKQLSRPPRIGYYDHYIKFSDHKSLKAFYQLLTNTLVMELV
jgi:hypothetical protein